ncbi:MAG: hypothetical protein JNK85_12380 [Verrucomicrobiales bacterium]|nr:hypothetical protein [Verrucomicrobiales bacterium]
MNLRRLAVALAVWGAVHATWAEFRAGIAVRVVTPQPLLPVSGGIGPSEPVTRKDGDLTVRALVLADGDTRVALVSVDFLGFPAVLGDRVRSLVQGIPAENILIGATHTHSAPDPYGFPDETGKTGADLNYLKFVVEQAGAAVNDALNRLAPASVKIATGEARGKIAYNAYAEALFDPRCVVVQCLDAAGKPMATLVNYAVHPEVFGSRAGTCSPDLVGPLYDRLAELGAGTGIFLNGAQGGMVTADNRGPDGRDVSSWAECVRIGNRLAEEAVRMVSDAPVQREPGLECRARTIRFPVESQVLLAVLRGSPMGYATDTDGRVSARLNHVRLGDAEMLTIPGEALPNVGAYLKRKMRGKHQLLLGLTNDAYGYILAKEDWGAFRRYEYISRTCLGERTGEILVNEALALIAEASK